MANPLPNTLRNFSVYSGSSGNKELGLAHITMPVLENISEVLKGSGISGEPDVPILGHVRNMTATFNYFVLTADAIASIAQVNQILNCRATLQTYDASGGQFGVVPERVLLNCFPRHLGLGRWEVASKGDMVTVEYNVHSISVYLSGNQVISIDPFNFVYMINGVDYLAVDRTLL